MKKIFHLFALTALLMMGGRSLAQNKHEYVDLGLPSGTLWATCNVGANAPWEYGDYFAWGETKTKNTYNESTYKHCKGNDHRQTKYCNKSDYGNNGFTDKLTVLKAGDDVATAKWGSKWCMPTKEQWEELRQCTIRQWTTMSGVNGLLFIAPNGQMLFLPAADCRLHDKLYSDVGNDGSYWSSSLDTDQLGPSCAWYLFFNSSPTYDGTFDTRSRYMGLSIRPVRSSRDR